jgi:4-amino-4-deoxy-L-arabinose transferase-like glycosyltransferase
MNPFVARSRLWFIASWALLSVWYFCHLILSGHWQDPPLPQGDGPDYESIAFNLSRGDGYQFSWNDADWQQPYRSSRLASEYTQFERVDWPGPTASRPPWLPTSIALVYQFLPRGPIAFAAIRSVSALCMALSGAIVVWLAFRVMLRFNDQMPLMSWAPELAAAITLVLALLDRTLRTYNEDFLTEPWALLWVSLFAAIAMEGRINQSAWNFNVWWDVVVVGILMGFMILTRSIAIFWLPGIAGLLWLITRDHSRRQRWFAMGTFVVIALLVVSPWWIRNVSVLNAFMPLGGQGAASLLGGYCDEALADYGNWHPEPENRLQKEIDGLTRTRDWTQAEREVELARRASAETREWIERHWQDLPKLMVARVVTHWGPFSGASLLWRLGILIGGMALIALHRREALCLVGLPLWSTLVVAFLYETGGRFLVPFYGLLYLVAAIGVTFCLERLFRQFCPQSRGNR